jgi:hypothetical protein
LKNTTIPTNLEKSLDENGKSLTSITGILLLPKGMMRLRMTKQIMER